MFDPAGLFLFDTDAHCQHVLAGPVQDPVGGGTEQQGEPVSTVTADDDDVGVLLVSDAMNLGLGTPEDEELAFRRDADGGAELGKVRFRLIVYLFLDRRQIHGNIAAIGEAQWFDDMYDQQLGVETPGDGDRAVGDPRGFLGEVYCQQDSLVGTHVVPHTIFARPYTFAGHCERRSVNRGLVS